MTREFEKKLNYIYKNALDEKEFYEKFNKATRQFKTGASRNSDTDKLDYEGFNSPIVNWYYAQYMHKHRLLEDGTLRDSDNWTRGFPISVIEKSLARHYQDYHLTTRGYDVMENGEKHDIKDVLCGIIFNAKAHLHELLKDDKIIERNYTLNK